MADFSVSMGAWCDKVKDRILDVRNVSASRVVEVMQEPGPSRATAKKAIAEGVGLGKNGGYSRSKKAVGPIPNPGGSGILPVDTGYLRSSLRATIGDDPVPITVRPENVGQFSYDDSEVTLAIANASISDTLTFVYTASYAIFVHYGTAVMAPRPWVALAAQQWPRIVSEVAGELQSK